MNDNVRIQVYQTGFEKKPTEGLRFAALIRVSTEDQDKKKKKKDLYDSLQNQEEQILAAVKMLGAKPISKKLLNRYRGQEHATPESDRKLFDKLLEDAGKGMFDAIMVADLSRWSRDTEANERGLKILRKHKIRFFELFKEWNLWDPQDQYIMNNIVALQRMVAMQNAMKSVMNRIGGIQNGIPRWGNLPYARIYDKETGEWGIDETKAKNLRKAALLYISDDPPKAKTLAKLMDVNLSYMYEIFRRHCGDSYEFKISSERLNINFEGTMKVPRLLSEEMIKKVNERTEANKTYRVDKRKAKRDDNGEILRDDFGNAIQESPYLLARMIFCKDCGRSLYAHRVKRKGSDLQWQYYRHSKWEYRVKKDPVTGKTVMENGKPVKEKVACDAFKYIPAWQIEEPVLKEIFELIGDRPKREKALKQALPNEKKLKQFREDLRQAKQELKEVEEGRQRLASAISSGILTEEDAKKEVASLNKRQEVAEYEIERLNRKMEAAPNLKLLIGDRKDLKELALEQAEHTRLGGKAHFDRMTLEEKRAMLQAAFAGTDSDGNRLGVYLSKGKRGWRYEIRLGWTNLVGYFEGGRGSKPKDQKFQGNLLDSHRPLSQFWEHVGLLRTGPPRLSFAP